MACLGVFFWSKTEARALLQCSVLKGRGFQLINKMYPDSCNTGAGFCRKYYK